MASYTPNINLKKPTTDEYYNVLDENQNKDKIDTAIGTLNSQLAVAPVTFTSYDDLKSGIQTKAGTMASGSIASFDFRANFSTTAELPNAYYTCIIRKYDNNSYLADIISNTGADYKLSYAGNTWKLTSLSSHMVTVKQYSATTETNANVSPWGAYCQISIPSEERTSYGNIFSVSTHSASTNPSMGAITSGEGGVMIYSKSPATFNISVGFIKSRAT